MKSVITKSFAYGWMRGSTTVFNTATKKMVVRRGPIPQVTANEVERAKRETLSYIKKPGLKTQVGFTILHYFAGNLLPNTTTGKFFTCTLHG